MPRFQQDDNNGRLLEINSSPALGATTSVTSRLCSAVLEDVVKVSNVFKCVQNPQLCAKSPIVQNDPSSEN